MNFVKRFLFGPTYGLDKHSIEYKITQHLQQIKTYISQKEQNQAFSKTAFRHEFTEIQKEYAQIIEKYPLIKDQLALTLNSMHGWFSEKQTAKKVKLNITQTQDLLRELSRNKN